MKKDSDYLRAQMDPEINRRRVEFRVAQGGHNVKKEKISQRYFNSLELLSEAIPYCYRGYLFDNSGDNSDFILEINPQKKLIISFLLQIKYLNGYKSI